MEGFYLRLDLKEKACSRRHALGAGLLAVTLLAGCRSRPSPISSARSERALGGNLQQRLGHGMKLLLDSIENPGGSFHLSFKGQENINPKYIQNANAKPEIGPVELEADVTPDEVSLTETRGEKKTSTKAKKGDKLGWSMANLAILGALLEPNLALAFGGMAVRSASSDIVGGIAADRIEFDTSKVPSAKAGLELAGGILGGKAKFGSVKGTAWLEEKTGRLVKFNVDADISDKAGNNWQEHHEATVTPK